MTDHDSEPGLAALIALLTPCRRLFVLTGAGCSTESGIPDYRGPDGAWKHRQPMQYREFVGSPEARQRYWSRSLGGVAPDRRGRTQSSPPCPGTTGREGTGRLSRHPECRPASSQSRQPAADRPARSPRQSRVPGMPDRLSPAQSSNVSSSGRTLAGARQPQRRSPPTATRISERWTPLRSGFRTAPVAAEFSSLR